MYILANTVIVFNFTESTAVLGTWKPFLSDIDKPLWLRMQPSSNFVSEVQDPRTPCNLVYCHLPEALYLL